jgi:hypothetical protein
VSRGWLQLDHAKFYERAVEAAFPFRGRCEVGPAAMLNQARSCREDFIKRQTGMLQSHRPKKSDIEV